MTLILLRSQRTPDGTFGALSLPDPHGVLVTVEDDWRDNAPRVSCIPSGSYVLHQTMYHKHNYETFEVTGVPGRSRILIHPANTEEDVEGCIGVGTRLGSLRVKVDEDTGAADVVKQAVVESKVAFNRFMAAMAGRDTDTLVVSWGPGLP